MANELPPCGLYRTVLPIGNVEAGRLVYFHNHGNPGPGVYFPERWAHNRATFSQNGTTLPPEVDASKALRPLPAEGFYRVTKAFFCCEKECTRFEPDTLVQLGYNGAAKALLFVPELGPSGVRLPERGTLIDEAAFGSLAALKVPMSEARDDLSLPRGLLVH
ncbi:MAG TPA: hypothetical protein VM513_03000 [Kofleriaceae bacterium]|nr:hypothetical protein [Kofleriaceae bacterium]